MKIWISGSVEDVIKASNTGLVDGIVTNPTVMARWMDKGQSLEELVEYIVEETAMPLYIQLKGPDVSEFRRECDYLKEISGNIIPKIPSTLNGIQAAGILEDEGVETLVTTVCSLNQAYACAAANVTTICPYYNRVKDNKEDADGLLKSITDMYESNGVETEVIPASIRSSLDVTRALTDGSNGVIIFYKIFKQLFNHEVTERSLQDFEKDWEKITF